MDYLAKTLSSETYEIMLSQLSKTRVLEAYLMETGGSYEGFGEIAQILLKEDYVRNVLFAPEGIVQEVYPLKGNESVLGLDMSAEGAGNKEAQAAVEKGELYMAGTSRLAHQPNASDLAPLLDALEEQVVLMRLMNTLSEEDTDTGVGVAIGSETGTPGLIHASVVTSGYGRTADDGEDGETSAHHQSLAFVGSIGPTHMNYMTTISAVRAVARYLTALITPQEHPQ